MKKILCILTIIFTVLFVCSCAQNTADSEGKLTKNVELYFSNADYNDVFAEKRTVVYEREDDFIRAVFNEILKGPADVNAKSVVPEGTSLLNFNMDGYVLNLNLSHEFLNYEGEHSKSAQLLARYSLVKSMCGFENVEKVHFFVDGEELLNSSGSPVGDIGEDDILFSFGGSENLTEKYVTLYFANSDFDKLVSRRKKVQLTENSIEKTIVSELLTGPDDDRLYSAIPKGTKVISVETKAEICFVNLSGDFVENFVGGSAAAEMAIYSIVNSLTELPDIDKVQFLIDSVKIDIFGDYIFSDPFERNLSLVE